MTRESFVVEHDSSVKETIATTPVGSSVKDKGKGRKMKSSVKAHLPLIILGVVFIGVLIGLIVVGVLFGQERKKVEDLQNTMNGHAAVNATTQSPGGGTGPGGTSVTGTAIPGVTGPTLTPLKPGSLRLPRINLNGVLTNQIDPINYELFLKIHLPYDANDTIPEPLTTRGNTVAITLKTPDSNLKSITLHVRHEVPADSKTGHILRFAKDKVTVTKKAERTAVVVDSLEYLTSDLVVINLASTLVVNEEYVLKIEFDGVIAQDNQGLYLSQYMKDGQLRNLIVSQFQAFKARRAFPCFDEPGYRSTFTTTLQYPKRFGMTRTNEDVDPSNPASEVNANGLLWTKTVYKTSARMPVYLNAFLVSDANDFKFHEPIVMAQNYGTSFPAFPVNTIGNAELVAGPNNRRDGRFAAEQGRDMIQALKNWFEQPYTISKLDQAGVPDFSAGAMENWGLVVYREASLLYQPQVSTADQKRGVAAIIGHELAHMIFGNLLTCQWWSDTWLNEGFARFMQYELMYRTKPRWNLPLMFTYWVVREAMSQDAFTTTHALSDPSVETIADINGMFSTITYAKGASILHMIKGLMQETPFFNALKQYVKVNADIPTRPELLMTELDKVYNIASDKLSERLSKWIYQKGYPVVTVSRNYDSANPNDISYTQKRFLLPVAPGSSAPVLNETDTWDVPLTLISGAFKDDLQAALQAANRPCWVSSASEKLPDRCLTIFTEKPTVVAGTDQTSNFIIANVQQFGFYRVNYDISNWNRIIRALGAYTSGADQRNVLHDVHTRGQLIDDSFNLARADQLGTGNQYEIPLRLINIYLTKEQSYGPLASAMDNLRYIDQMLRGTPDYPQFAGYMQNLAGQLYKKSMWETNWKDSWTTADQESESSYGTLMFNTLVIETACFYGVSDCLTEADTRFAAWVARGKDRAFTADERPPNENLIQTKNLVLCYGMREGKPSYWKFMKELLVVPGTITTSKLSLLRGMACSRDESQLHEVLMAAIDPDIVRSQDENAVFGYLNKFNEAHVMTWEFVQREWSNPLLTNRANVVATFGSSLKTKWRIDQLKALFERAKGGKDAKDIPEGATFVRAIERAEINRLWVEKHGGNIAALVSQLTPGTDIPPTA